MQFILNTLLYTYVLYQIRNKCIVNNKFDLISHHSKSL